MLKIINKSILCIFLLQLSSLLYGDGCTHNKETKLNYFENRTNESGNATGYKLVYKMGDFDNEVFPGQNSTNRECDKLDFVTGHKFVFKLVGYISPKTGQTYNIDNGDAYKQWKADKGYRTDPTDIDKTEDPYAGDANAWKIKELGGNHYVEGQGTVSYDWKQVWDCQQVQATNDLSEVRGRKVCATSPENRDFFIKIVNPKEAAYILGPDAR